jgi:hypothetical protein
MSSLSPTSSTKKRRLIRGIALLFLVYTAIDIVSPELCRGEILGDSGQQPFASAPTRLIDGLSSTVFLIEAADSQRTNEPPQEPLGDDDCCFCCCAHVLPGAVIANVAVTDVRSSVTFLKYLSVPSPPLTPAFHPPRFA